LFRHRLLPFAAAALIAACQATPPAGVPGVQAVAGRGNVVIAPTFTGGASRRLLAVVSPYTDASIDHMLVKLYTVTGPPGSEVETYTNQFVDVGQADLLNTISFTNLNFNTTYRVRATAFKAPGTAAVNVISDASSYADLTVAMNDRPVLGNLVVQLVDQTFAGEATSTGTTITAGQVLHSGTEGAAVVQTRVFNRVRAHAPGQAGLAVGAIAVDATGVAYFTDAFNNKVWKVPAGGGTPVAFADVALTNAGMNGPGGIVADPDGNLYVGDASCIYFVTSAGDVSVFAGAPGAQGDVPDLVAQTEANPLVARFFEVRSLVLAPDGDLIALDGRNLVVRRIDAETGAVSNVHARNILSSVATAVGYGRDGHYYISDNNLNKIVRVTAAGVSSIFAGDGNVDVDDGPAGTASFGGTFGAGLAFDAAGYLYVADNERVRRIDSGGRVSTVAGQPGVYTSALGTTFQSAGDYGTAAFARLAGLAFQPDGDLLVTDTGAHVSGTEVVRRVSQPTP